MVHLTLLITPQPSTVMSDMSPQPTPRQVLLKSDKADETSAQVARYIGAHYPNGETGIVYVLTRWVSRWNGGGGDEGREGEELSV